MSKPKIPPYCSQYTCLILGYGPEKPTVAHYVDHALDNVAWVNIPKVKADWRTRRQLKVAVRQLLAIRRANLEARL